MTPRALRRVVDAAGAGSRLDALLVAWLPGALDRPLSKAVVRRLIMAGAVDLDGRVRRQPGLVLRAGARIGVRVDRARLPAAERGSGVFVFDARRVLFEGGGLLAVDKPPGLALHATADAGRPHLVGAVLAWLLSRAPVSEGLPYLGVHQRLDRDTSGVVLFTTQPEANAGLAQQFERRAVHKVYQALVARPARLPPRAWSAEQPLGRVGRGRMGVVAPAEGGLLARTDFRLLEAGARLLLIEARPLTGRQHQIRVHLALCGLPIAGDDIYGRPGGDVPRLMLHAARLELRHPRSGAPLSLCCPLPADFCAALAAARPARTRRR